MSDATVQIIRSMVQAFWTAVLSLAVVDNALTELGVDSTAATAIAVPVTMAAVVWLGRQAPKVWRGFGWLINGIDRPPAYDTEAA